MDALEGLAVDVLGFSSATEMLIALAVAAVAAIVLPRLFAFLSGEDKVLESGGGKPVEVAKMARKMTVEGDPDEPVFTEKEVAEHSTRDDCWLILDGGVYDVTTYIDQHVGGDVIFKNAGRDNTERFHAEQHEAKTFQIVKQYRIGKIKKK
jgi:predicted heme/steroid binding protein